MKVFLQDYFDDLKSQVLQKAGIHNISPSDCYQLALSIQKDTEKRISETTLKRIYGFAAACYQPSTYTLNTLSQYCGRNSWSDFMAHCEQQQHQPSHQESTWAVIRQTAHKISRFSIESNKHKSGIPYSMTVSCNTLAKKIQQFDESAIVACVLHAPSGGGKTIGLTRWIDSRLNQRPRSEKNNDIFLFINAFTLVSASVFGYHGNHWLSYILGLPKQDLLDEFMDTYQADAPGKFYLVIDNMHNSPITDRQYQIIFSQLIDMAYYFSSYPWFKIILSVRTPVWQKYRYLLERNPSIQRLWFSDGIDLNGLSYQAIQRLTANITGASHTSQKNGYDTLTLISHPLYFQIYYQLKDRNITPENLSLFDQHLIIGHFINQYALKGMHYIEKRKLLDRLSRFVVYKNHTLCVDDQKVFSVINQFTKAFRELTACGLIYLHQSEVGSRQVSEIRFQSATAGAYFIAQRILQKNRNLFDASLIQTLNNAYYPDLLKREIFHWLFIFSIESGHFSFLNFLEHPQFLRSKELEFMCLADGSLRHLLKGNLLDQFNQAITHSGYIDYVLSHLFVEPAYEVILQQLLTYRIRDEHRILLHSALGLIALFKLRDDEMAFHLEKMREIDVSAYAKFSLNPSIQLEALFHYFRYGTISKHALKEITVFSFHPQRNQTYVQHQLLFTLSILASKLSNGTLKTLRFLRAIQKCQAFATFSAEYLDLMQLIRAREWLKNNNIAKAEAIQYATPITLKHRALIQILHSIYQIELNLAKRVDSLTEIRESIYISQKHFIPISEALVRLLYVQMYQLQADHKAEISVQEAALKGIFKNTGFQLDAFRKLVLFNTRKINPTVCATPTTEATS